MHAIAVIIRAQAFRVFKDAGAVAFSRTGDTGAGKVKDAKLLKTFGDAPDDLSVAIEALIRL
jgi:hypothetical protein